jgi:porin
MTGAPNRVRIGSLRLAGVCALGLGLAPALAFAQYAPPPPEVIDLGSMTDPPPDLLDGTLSGLGDELDNESTEENGSSWLRFASPMQPWLDFKQNVLLQQYGLMIGGSEGILGQDFSNSLTNNHSAVGQKFTMNVGQQLLWKGTPEALWIEMVVEDRGPVGTEFAPLQAGLRTGSSTATAPTWGDFNLGVTQLYLRQNLFDNHFQYTFGKIFAPNYVNPYPLFDDNRQYLNQIFTTSVTIPVPLRGFGAVAAWFPTDYGLYAKGGIYTVYSDDTGFTADSFFNRPEYFRHLELGWSGIAANGTPIQARGPMDANNFSVTLWDKDAEQNGPPAAHGVAFNANYLIQPNLMLFGRGG